MTDTTEPASAAASAERINAERAARQRQQRRLQLEDHIADAQRRVGIARGRLNQAQERLAFAERTLADLQGELAALTEVTP